MDGAETFAHLVALNEGGRGGHRIAAIGYAFQEQPSVRYRGLVGVAEISVSTDVVQGNPNGAPRTAASIRNGVRPTRPAYAVASSASIPTITPQPSARSVAGLTARVIPIRQGILASIGRASSKARGKRTWLRNTGTRKKCSRKFISRGTAALIPSECIPPSLGLPGAR